jgi:L-threonylcarbamoyladenylate synthase
MTRITLDLAQPIGSQLAVAVEAIDRGDVVAFPTDTLYGLAVNPHSDRALTALFALKGRTADRTVALIAGSLRQAEAVGEITGTARRLAERFWPGPLTLVVPARDEVASLARSGDGLVGVRVPDHAIARAFADACGHALTATSANRSGQPATHLPGGVSEALPGVAVLVDAGPSPGGLPSTILHAATSEVRLLREGALPWSDVLEFLRSLPE